MVSVIIPCYNAAEYVDAAIESVLVQLEQVKEIFLVDNNSTDGTRELLEAYCRQYPSVIRVLLAQRQGAAAARNAGLYEATGDWIQFLDADDVLLPGKLIRQLKLVNGEVDWVIGRSYIKRESGAVTLSEIDDDPWKGLVFQGKAGDTNSNLFRRSALIAISGQDESLASAEDLDMCFRLLKLGGATVTDWDVGAEYRQRSGTSLSNAPGDEQRFVELAVRILTFLAENKSAYYEANKVFFRSSLLKAIRILATADSALANEYYTKHFPSFRLGEVKQEMTSSVVMLYPFLGFRRTERIRLWITKYRRKVLGVF